MTSVHDVTLREAWSRVIQGVMEMLPSVESLLVNFTGVSHSLSTLTRPYPGSSVRADLVQSSGMDNTYLFDISSRVVVASDNRGRNDATTQLVTEYLDRFLQFRDLYKCLGKRKEASPGTKVNGEPNGVHPDSGDQESTSGSWWDDEDPDKPWMTQSTRLMPNTTIAMWQFTP